MELLETLFGVGRDLNAWQMMLRALVVFLICLVLVRVSGRRSFGISMPVDNVTSILLGAILSRTVTGASPFLETVAAATVLAVLHRLFGWLAYYDQRAGKILKGSELLLYKNGKYFEDNMRYGMVTKKDILSEVRSNAHTDNLEGIDSIFLERDGKISVIKKT
jgi:uncharacterized membrane protein YcaP (DUF421 family)